MIQSRVSKNLYSIKYFTDNLYKFTYYKTNRLTGGQEKLQKIKLAARNKYDNKLNNNLSRARTAIFEYASCNDFDFFITFTLDKTKYNRYDLDKYIKDLGQYIRDYRKNLKVKIQYLLIPELHKDGAYHLHGMIQGLNVENLRLFTLDENLPKYIRDKLLKGEKVYEWVEYRNKFGFNDIEVIKNKEACSKYITKYVTKSFNTRIAVAKNKKLYYVTRGLRKSIKIEEGVYCGADIPIDFQNDYIATTMLDYSMYNAVMDYIKN